MSIRQTDLASLEHTLQKITDEILASINTELSSRAYRIGNELRNSLNLVMRGDRNGRRYIIPGTGRMRYYKRNTGARGIKYNKDNMTASYTNFKHKAGTASITYKHYTASAPGEVPAVRTGAFRSSWQPRTTITPGAAPYDLKVQDSIESNTRVGKRAKLLGEILENGTDRIAPRPYKQRTVDRAMPKVQRIIKESYLR